jgi:hypothetical protein
MNRELYKTIFSFSESLLHTKYGNFKIAMRRSKNLFSEFGGHGVSALAFGTQVRGFKPGRSRRIFQGEKILSAPFFGR